MKLAINVGSGGRPHPDTEDTKWLNLDIRPLPTVDIVRDVRRGIPVNDCTFDELLADNVLEHFASEDAIFLINEFYRVLKFGGKAEIIVPRFSSGCSVQDPTHKSFYSASSSLYWSIAGRTRMGVDVGITADFNVTVDNLRDFLIFKLRKRGVDTEAELPVVRSEEGAEVAKDV